MKIIRTDHDAQHPGEEVKARHRWTPGVVEQLRRHHATIGQLLAAEQATNGDANA